jgi:hypothetical protein
MKKAVKAIYNGGNGKPFLVIVRYDINIINANL